MQCIRLNKHSRRKLEYLQNLYSKIVFCKMFCLCKILYSPTEKRKEKIQQKNYDKVNINDTTGKRYSAFFSKNKMNVVWDTYVMKDSENYTLYIGIVFYSTPLIPRNIHYTSFWKWGVTTFWPNPKFRIKSMSQTHNHDDKRSSTILNIK